MTDSTPNTPTSDSVVIDVLPVVAAEVLPTPEATTVEPANAAPEEATAVVAVEETESSPVVVAVEELAPAQEIAPLSPVEENADAATDQVPTPDASTKRKAEDSAADSNGEEPTAKKTCCLV